MLRTNDVESRTSLRQIVAAYLDREGKSLRGWARELGISPAYLSAIQHGARMPHLPLALRLAADLGVSPDVFVPDASGDGDGGE